MPIRPENKARYPKDWKDISLRIRKRARKRCECRGECGLDHFEEMDTHYGRDYTDNGRNQPDRCMARNYEPHYHTGSKVILTTAHLDHTPENCADTNLKAMCQRCHLRMDRHIHAANRKETHARKKAENRATLAVRELV